MAKNNLNANDYLEIYRVAHNNAADLLKEAELLFDHKCFARAYALAFTALEEISKSQFAADVFTGLCTGEEFERFYKDHKRKIQRATLVYRDANSYNLKWVGPDIDDFERINPKEPNFNKRLNALYSGIDVENQRILIPEEQISEKDAEEMIHVVQVALYEIMLVTEYYGNQIGTKGFEK